MKHLRTLAAALLLAVPMMGRAQADMRQTWLSMPDSIVPYLNQRLRKEHLDFRDMQIESRVNNLLQGQCVMDTLTERYLSVRLSSHSALQLRLFQRPDSTQMVCMVRTFKAPEAESEVRFFISDWAELNGRMGLPPLTDSPQLRESFTERPDTMAEEQFLELQKMLSPLLIEARLQPDEEGITLQVNPLTFTKEEQARVKAILKQRKFKWNGEIFKEY